MPDVPAGELLAEMAVEGQGATPWVRRVHRDGAIWEHTDLRTWIEDGQVRQAPQPAAWGLLTTAPPEALARIEEVVRAHGLMDATPAGRAAADAPVTTWRLAVDGREHEIRLEHVPPDRVPGLEELRMALELAVAMGADAEAPG